MMNDDLNIALGAVQEIKQELGREVIDHGFIKEAASDAEAKIEAALAALEAESLAVGWLSRVQATEYVEGKTRLLVICADGSQGLGIDQPVIIHARKHHAA